MSEDDRRRWDERYGATVGDEPGRPLAPPPLELVTVVRTLQPNRRRFGRKVRPVALDLACGTGRAALWLATQGWDVVALDISAVALRGLRARAVTAGVADRVRTVQLDLDEGVGALVGCPCPRSCSRLRFDLIVCLRFRGDAVGDAVSALLAPGGTVVTSRLSAVGRSSPCGPAPAFVARPGELAEFAARHRLRVVVHREANGEALLVATA